MLLDDILQIGYGGMGLHPWEFSEYTYAQFVYKYRGYESARRETIIAIDDSIRWAAYCQIMPTLDKKYKSIKIEQLVPSRYENAKAKPKSTETPEQRAARHYARSQELDRLKKKKNAGQQ